MANPKLEEAKRLIRNADHLLYITFPIIKENRLLAKILDEMGKAMGLLMEDVLQREKNVSSSGWGERMIDFSKCSSKYGMDDAQISNLGRMMEMVQKRRESVMDFSRQDRLIMMSESLVTESLTSEDLKRYLSVSKDMLKKVENSFSKDAI